MVVCNAHWLLVSWSLNNHFNKNLHNQRHKIDWGHLYSNWISIIIYIFYDEVDLCTKCGFFILFLSATQSKKLCAMTKLTSIRSEWEYIISLWFFGKNMLFLLDNNSVERNTAKKIIGVNRNLIICFSAGLVRFGVWWLSSFLRVRYRHFCVFA